MGILSRIFGRSHSSPSTSATPSPPRPDWPYPLHEIAGASTLSEIDRLNRASNGAQFSILLGAPDELGMLSDGMATEKSPSDILAIVRDLSIGNVLRRMRSLSDEGEGIEVGEWPEDPGPPIVVSGHLTSSRQKPLSKVLVTTLPTSNAFECPAFLKYGGWNSCPESEYHVALHKYWQEKYGATIVTMTHDVIECTVKRRPATKDEALALAWEQFFYAPDIVTQGTEEIAPLAATLMNSDAWFFWWD